MGGPLRTKVSNHPPTFEVPPGGRGLQRPGDATKEAEAILRHLAWDRFTIGRLMAFLRTLRNDRGLPLSGSSPSVRVREAWPRSVRDESQ